MSTTRSLVTYPTGAAAIPLLRGWRGLIIIRVSKTREVLPGWECPHHHLYRDTAEHCAAVVYRRWQRTGERP